MIKQLMPYGSSRYAILVAKVGSPKQSSSRDDSALLPYGEGRLASLAAKVGTSKNAPQDHAPLKVVRLNARTR